MGALSFSKRYLHVGFDLVAEMHNISLEDYNLTDVEGENSIKKSITYRVDRNRSQAPTSQTTFTTEKLDF